MEESGHTDAPGPLANKPMKPPNALAETAIIEHSETSTGAKLRRGSIGMTYAVPGKHTLLALCSTLALAFPVQAQETTDIGTFDKGKAEMSFCPFSHQGFGGYHVDRCADATGRKRAV